MDLKTLTRQHEEFAASQARKAAREKVKAEREAARQARWTLQKETQRRTRERKDRAWDLAQQRRLDDSDAVFVGD